MEQLYAKDQVQVAAFGEFMLRLHSGDSRRFLQAGEYKAYYAGAEANLSVLLARMGVPVRYITRIPQNDIAMGGVEQVPGARQTLCVAMASGVQDNVTGVAHSALVTPGSAACALTGTSAAAAATTATRMERRAMSGNPSDTCRYLHGELPTGRHRTVGTGRIGSPSPVRPPEDHLFGGAAGVDQITR